MNLNTSHGLDASVVISVIALISSWAALYFQFFYKRKKLLLNIFEMGSHTRRDIATTRFSLSNVGNTTILLSDVRFQTKTLNSTSTYITTVFPNELPKLIKPDDTYLYTINSGTELYLTTIENLMMNRLNAREFNIYLEFTLVVNGHTGKYQILLNKTIYYNPNKVHSQYSPETKNIILNKYRSDYFYISFRMQIKRTINRIKRKIFKK